MEIAMHIRLFSKVLLLQVVTLFLMGGSSICSAAIRKPINTVPKNGFEFKEPATAPAPVSPAPVKTTAQVEPVPAVEKKPAKPSSTSKKLSSSESVVSHREQAKPPPRQGELLLPRSHDQRFFQIRGGPRLAQVYGKLRPGNEGGSNLDLRKDLALTDLDTGPQLDFELRLSDRAYGRVVFTSDAFEGSLSTGRPINYVNHRGTANNTEQSPAVLAAGSSLRSKLDLNLLQVVLGYDIYRDDSLSLGVLFGSKMVFATATMHAVNAGVAENNANRIIDHVITVNEVTPVVGLEFRAQINPHLYVGLTPAGFGWENFNYIGGQAFVGYDFDKTFGVRLGMDFDHLTVSRGTGPTYALSDATLAAAFIQGVFGY